MKHIYFKTRSKFNKFLKENDLRETTVDCSGGETTGAYIYENRRMVGKVILDAVDFDNAPIFERGE
jgi:hypothetical protein